MKQNVQVEEGKEVCAICEDKAEKMTDLLGQIRKAVLPTKAERIERYKEDAELLKWKLERDKLEAEGKELTQKSRWNPDTKHLSFMRIGGRE